MPDPTRVRDMFGRIAGRYDLLNRVLSMGIDQRWRRAALAELGELSGKLVVDACCGTGDVALALREAGARVVGVDFTREMLVRARSKGTDAGLEYALGDALRLPLEDGEADAVTCAFGIRNVADRVRGLAEFARVVRPGGTVLVLEFSLPPGRLLGALYRLYFTRVLPLLGGAVSGDRGAYEYLPDTVLAWPDPEAFRAEFESVGLVDCGFRRLTFGIACLHWGRVPVSPKPGA